MIDSCIMNIHKKQFFLLCDPIYPVVWVKIGKDPLKITL